jgi:putative thioredoxin
MTSPFIINVTEASFESEVINFSQQVPVVVDFWADWCVPCKMLTPILTKFTEKAKGDFRLAKVNVDENQNLALRFNVRGIPAVKAFRDGAVVGEFTGVKPEQQIGEFLRNLVPSPSDLLLDKGHSLLKSEDFTQAETAFQQVLDDRPEDPRALLGLAKCLLAQGYGAKAGDILQHFPPSPEFSSAEQLIPLAVALNQYERGDQSEDAQIDATYYHALWLVTHGNLPAAMDGILDVLRKDKHYRNDGARGVILGILEILGSENPTARKYRAELASVLF